MPPRRKEPKTILSISAWNGDHEVILRLTKRQRYFLLACLVALISGGAGTTLGAAIEIFKMMVQGSVLP